METKTKAAIKAPHGIFEIGGSPLTNPCVGGDRQTINWNQVNPSEGTFNWKQIDAAIAGALGAKKQLGSSVCDLSLPPAWLVEKGAKLYTSPNFKKGPMVLPFDPVAQPALLAFIKALCLHLDGKVDYITMGGMGYKTETYMPLPSDIGYSATTAEFISKWVASSNLVIDTYAANLKQTPFIIAAGTPFDDPTAVSQMTSVITHGLVHPLFGIMQWGLNAKSNSGFYINAFIQNKDVGRATGFQMTGSQTEPHVGGQLQGTLEDCLKAAKAMQADFVEVYSQDAENTALQPMIQTYNLSLS